MVILVAQVFNGCLLPFLSSLLLICINDPQFMGERPQPVWANVLMVVSVMITMFLASNVIIQKIFASLLTCPACVNIRQTSPLQLGAFCAIMVCLSAHAQWSDEVCHQTGNGGRGCPAGDGAPPHLHLTGQRSGQD